MFNIVGFYSAIKFDWNDRFVFSGESHDFWEAVFVDSGEVEVTEDENVYILSAGNIIFHAPMEFHRIKSSGGTEPKGFIFSFYASGELPETIKSGVFTLEPSQLDRFKNICNKIYAFMHGDHSPLLGQETSALLTAFIIKLSSKQAISRDSVSVSAVEYRRIVSFMSEEICENLTLSEIAKSCNVSVSYIKLLFSTYAGISPKSYFNQLRIRYATELLSQGSTVTEVSDKMNFSSPNYFSAFYKKHTGMTPSEQQKS
jgi:AraC-like DNA-binding protein